MGRVITLLWVLAMGTASAGSVSKLTSTRSFFYNLGPLVDGTSQSLRLLGARSIRFKTLLKPGFRVEFEDKFPGANWGHPAVYRVRDERGKVVEEIHSLLPPVELPRAKKLSDLLASSPESNAVPMEVKDLGGALRIKESGRHFALLFNGHADQRHWNDFSFLYRTLTTVYGYDKGNIIVADGIHRGTMPDLDGDGVPDITHGSSLDDLKRIIDELKARLKKSDHLLLVVNDHGGTNGKESTILLFEGEITASEFGKLLAQLPPDKMLSIYEQCFSGGFVRPSIQDSRVAMAAATNTEFSWATADLRFDEFLYHLTSAFAMQTHEGIPVNADLNADGRISAQEAFSYASGKDSAPESPVLEASANSGMASAIGIGF